MDKNAIKKYAVWARRELISRVAQRAALYEITEDGFGDPEAQSAHGRVLTDEDKAQRRALVARIRQEGYQQVMEEVAYTWFNRFIALRFMEVNGYLPSRVRVFTDENNQFKPQILAEAMNLELDGLDPQKVYAFKNTNDNDGLFKYMVIVQCNALSAILPGMFQRISDYTELLFPDNLLREGSVVEQMISAIPEDDWRDAVQIIGWLYQYYNAEKKDEVFAALKKNVKITKENIPAATQLFTPDWIVRYMVENSLGRLWVEGHPNDDLKANWKYYLEEAQQEPDVQVQLAEIRKEYAAMKPEDIKCIDPCCGSGHILAYLFDVLVQIYESYGYTTREAVESIVQNNLYGLDIDDRAAQLAYFAVMMKARQYDRRFFSRQIQPNVYAIQESNGIDRYALEYFCNGDAKLKAAMDSIITEMHDAKEYGSILNVTPVDFAALYARFDEVRDDISMSKESVLNSLLPLVQVAHALAKKYDVVVTNPPYMGIKSGMTTKLAEMAKKKYPNSKNDLYAVFIERCLDFSASKRFVSMITQHSWMFQSSFAKIREKVINCTIDTLIHLGANAFDEINGEVVQTCAFVIRQTTLTKQRGCYVKLVDEDDEHSKNSMFLSKKNRFYSSTMQFKKTADHVVSYWISEEYYKLFKEDTVGKKVFTFQGIITGKTDIYLKLWYEINYKKIIFGASDYNVLETANAYYPYNKGGSFRRWFGNREYVIHWMQNGQDYVRSRTENRTNFFREGLTWSDLCTGKFSCRKSEEGFLFDASGPMLFPNNPENVYKICGYLNSKVFQSLLDINSQGLHYGNGAIASQPIILNDIDCDSIVKNCINISKHDWDSFETSWDFKRHPLL